MQYFMALKVGQKRVGEAREYLNKSTPLFFIILTILASMTLKNSMTEFINVFQVIKIRKKLKY